MSTLESGVSRLRGLPEGPRGANIRMRDARVGGQGRGFPRYSYNARRAVTGLVRGWGWLPGMQLGCGFWCEGSDCEANKNALLYYYSGSDLCTTADSLPSPPSPSPLPSPTAMRLHQGYTTRDSRTVTPVTPPPLPPPLSLSRPVEPYLLPHHHPTTTTRPSAHCLSAPARCGRNGCEE